MEYQVTIDVAGTDVEIDVEICDDVIHEYVTNGNCSDWAIEHFEDCCNVYEYVAEYLEDLSEDDLINLVAPIMGIET